MRRGFAAVVSLLVAGAVLVSDPVAASTKSPPTAQKQDETKPLVIAHRGASGFRPEHTLAAYEVAIEMGADVIEPDVVSTKDGVLVARHENQISGTTDVAEHPEFADRRTTKTIDGKDVTGWFTEDFTLAELKTLRAKERLPGERPGNTRYDGLFEVPTVAEVFALAQRESRRERRTIRVAPETKHPTYFDSIGLSLEEPLAKLIKRYGYDRHDSPVLVQSFEVSNLEDMDRLTKASLVQLVSASGAPYDQVEAGTGLTYAQMLTPEGLADIRTYADWVAPEKKWVLPQGADGYLTGPTETVADAHEAGLKVVVWTMREENKYMAADFRNGTDPLTKGDIAAEVTAFLDEDVDAFFADYPDSAVQARDAWLESPVAVTNQ
ncbi:glycerophosphoryl diester phosphodiesterase [Nocardioides luteus]|uniref:glycerophosphodiester phosphodiesterase n=2 Tax=Nocardioides luteus TaxID=1844 RepID=A0ABQ5T492_9ACTN|nr:glycerophosphoryl diester phosphodiesterase [Nocardioides luteus]GLJ70643.1 glycerophosphoryl diester phosphodiesterase [Nocardioides luteus]